MRKHSLISLSGIALLLLTGYHSFGQATNVYPTTGNVTFGTTSAANNLIVYGSIVQVGGTPTATSSTSTYMQTNYLREASSTLLNPGLLLFPSGTAYNFGMDDGYNATSGRFRTRIFAPAAYDVVLSSVTPAAGNVNPTLQTDFTDNLVVLGGSGNVLIGKSTQTNSTYRLDVVGNIRGNEVVVNTTGADFVFDPSYRLPKLADIAAYIRANHHLSGIPTAAEMEKDGLTLGATQTKLLQKVEELTLYAIEADKRYQELETANTKQAALLEAQQKTLDQQQKLLQKLEAKLDKH